MSEMIIDLSNFKDRMGAHVPPDRYRVQVEDVEATKSNAGNPMINVWFRIIGGDYDGQTIVDRLTLSEKALFRVVGFMQAIGLKTPKKRFKVNIQGWVGQILEIEVADGEPYNGRVKSEVRGYSRAARAASASADLEDEFAGLGDEFAGSDVDDLPEEDEAAEAETSTEEEKPAKKAAAKADDDGDDLDDIDLDDVEL